MTFLSQGPEGPIPLIELILVCFLLLVIWGLYRASNDRTRV